MRIFWRVTMYLPLWVGILAVATFWAILLSTSVEGTAFRDVVLAVLFVVGICTGPDMYEWDQGRKREGENE